MCSRRHIGSLYACFLPSSSLSSLPFESTSHFDPFHLVWSHLHLKVAVFSRSFHVPTFSWGRPFGAQFFERARKPLYGRTLRHPLCGLPTFPLPLHVLLASSNLHPFVFPLLVECFLLVASSAHHVVASDGSIVRVRLTDGAHLHCPWESPLIRLEAVFLFRRPVCLA